VGKAHSQVAETVSGWADGIKGVLPGGSQDQDDQQGSGQDDQQGESQEGEGIADPDGTGTENGQHEAPPIPDPNPMADKDALIATQIGNNVHILEIRANTSLGYEAGRDYGNADLNSSQPITNNIWQAPPDSPPVYYDQAVVGTVIAFDSQWIDYVNAGNQGVLGLMKPESEAYNKSTTYSKLGKIQETFQLLEIGEIRRGQYGFYVWVRESIQITEEGVAEDKSYNWIYYMEPLDGRMLVVDYYPY